LTDASESGAADVRILFQDGDIVAVSKPPGMLVHRGMGADRSEEFLLQRVRDMCGSRVHAAHRLDRPTCGVVLFAKSPEMARALQESWKSGAVRKTYMGICRGWMPDSDGLRDESLDDPDTGKLQEARTNWREEGRVELPFPLGGHDTSRFGLLRLEPHTGRWHQIRRHLSRMAHPLVGDTVHGDRRTNHLLQDKLGWWRLMLWARSLELPHPRSGVPLEIHDEGGGIIPFWEELVRLGTTLEVAA